MFSSTKAIKRGQCSCCGQLRKPEQGTEIKLYVLDIHDTDSEFGYQGKWEPKLVESDADFAACLKCWKFIGGYINNHVRVTSYE